MLISTFDTVSGPGTELLNTITIHLPAITRSFRIASFLGGRDAISQREVNAAGNPATKTKMPPRYGQRETFAHHTGTRYRFLYDVLTVVQIAI